MRILPFAALAAASCLPSCWTFKATALAGYSHMAVDGELGFTDGSSGGAARQDIESAFGLGDEQGTPYARVMVNLGVPVVSVSGFVFDEEGSGVLEANFGSNPILVAGVPVDSELEVANLKSSLAFAISLGPISVQPGLAVDYFDLHVQVRDQVGIATETLDISGPIPLLFVRGEVDVGIVSALVEVGYLNAEFDNAQGSLLDLEALVQFRPTALLTLFAGYQLIDLDADGVSDGDSFDADLQIGGFVVGGGLTW